MQQSEHAPAAESSFVALGLPLAAEEEARANLYGLLARLLLAPPDATLLRDLAASAPWSASDPHNPLAMAWDKLSLMARLLPLDVVTEEFNDLFISSAAPRISPHGSIYLAGFLHEKPLVQLRADLAALGLGRQAGARETEDHLGALCESMRQLIVRRQPIDAQQRFFDSHIASWSTTCLSQLQRLDGARFYAAVAELAAALIAIERQAFEVADEAA